MRRGVGISGLQHVAAANDHFKKVGNEVKQSNLQSMKKQLELFRSKLEEFAMKHKNEIRKDPEFRAKFHQMCANIGVDPLASNKGVWAKALGIGDFYYELGVQIVEACWATRESSGGLMELPMLLKYVNRRRGKLAEPVSEDDVVRAIKKIRVLGNGQFELVTIGKQQYIRSVPGELSLDSNKILELAQVKGYVTKSEVLKVPGWSNARTDAALEGMLKQGLAWVDDQAPGGERWHWFPCLSVNQL